MAPSISGTVELHLPAGHDPGPGGTQTFANAAAVTIPDQRQRDAVSLVDQRLRPDGHGQKVTASLTGFGHAFTDDVDVLLVGPGGKKMLLLSDAGGGGNVTGLNLTFDDAAASALPDGSSLTSGTWKPSVYEAGTDGFAPPRPGEPYGTALSAFNGTDPNGTWSLFVRDDFSASGRAPSPADGA